MKLCSMKRKIVKISTFCTNNLTNVDTSKVLLYTGGIEDMSTEIENHSSSMCRHGPISQETYISFVWACLNTVNELCLAPCPALSFCAVSGLYTSFYLLPPVQN